VGLVAGTTITAPLPAFPFLGFYSQMKPYFKQNVYPVG